MKISKIFVSALILTIFGANQAKSGGLSDLLGGDLGGTIGNMIEGVFSSSNITVADMEGEWTSTGPAVCFQGDGFLQKAGGIAAASAIESKLAPYYQQYGLNNAKLTIDNSGNFTLSCKMIKLNGTITQQQSAQPGVFTFNFTVGGMKLAGVTTYVQKTSTSMDVMFDATKLINLLSSIANYTGIQTVKTVTSLLDSYDGLCVGFNFKGGSTTGGANNGLGGLLNGLTGGKSSGTSAPKESEPAQGSDSGKSSGSNTLSNGLELLKGMLKK